MIKWQRIGLMGMIITSPVFAVMVTQGTTLQWVLMYVFFSGFALMYIIYEPKEVKPK